MVITDILKQNAMLYPNDPALTEINPEANNRKNVPWSEFDLVEANPEEAYRREITWKDFNDRANAFADYLISAGVKKGDKVGILLMNCLEWLPIYFGILKSGALAVPLNFRYTSDEIVYCLNLAEVSVLVFGKAFIDRVHDAIPGIPNVKKLYYVGADTPDFAENSNIFDKNLPTDEPGVELCPEDNAAIYFSSGTTGFPKAILHSHESLLSAVYTENNHHGQTKEDSFLCIPPLYHTGAKMHWFGSLLVGGKTVLLKGIKPRWILEAVSREKLSIVWLLVPWAQDLLDAIDSGDVNLEDYELSQWRLMHIGAQPVPPSLIHRWMKIFPHHQYDTNYGLSESIGPGCVHLGVDNIHKIGAIGKAGYNWQVKICDEHFNEVADGEVGELCVKGPGVMKCYYRDEKASAEVLRDGWLLTGDMARKDEDGFIFLVDRKKDVIISGGENIYPVQIEDFLRSHDAIKDVAVIGLPDHRLGEISAAIIELKPGIVMTEAEIMDFCNSLPRYKRPRRIIFDDIPRNPTGKIEKPRLREKYCGKSLVESQITN